MNISPGRRLPPAAFVVAAFGLGVLFIAGSFVFREQLRAMGDTGSVILGGATLLALAAAGALGWEHCRRLDEPAIAAHKTAWFLGGTAGMLLVTLGVAAVLMLPGGADLWEQFIQSFRGHMSPTTFALTIGVLACVALQGVCYGVAWVRWWARRRA